MRHWKRLGSSAALVGAEVEVGLLRKVPMELGRWGSVGTAATDAAAQKKAVGVGAGSGTRRCSVLEMKEQLCGAGEQPQRKYVVQEQRGKVGRQNTVATTRAAAAGGRPSNFLRLALMAPAAGIENAKCTADGTPSSGEYGRTRQVMAGANCCRTPQPAAPIRLGQGEQRTVAQPEGAVVAAAGSSSGSALQNQQLLLAVARCYAGVVEWSHRARYAGVEWTHRDELEKEYDRMCKMGFRRTAKGGRCCAARRLRHHHCLLLRSMEVDAAAAGDDGHGGVAAS
jgi:hypothetical protein